MIKLYQEAAVKLPQLSESSLYIKFDQQNQLTDKVKATLMNRSLYVKPEDMQEIMALIRLNGSAIAKKAVKKFEEGKLILIYDKDKSQIPIVLPYIIIQDKKKDTKAYVFADRVVNNLTSTSEYVNLMAVMEAAYLAAAFRANPDVFIMNRNLMISMCELYEFMWMMPLEQKLYMKGDNLSKAMAYIAAYFYRMIDGDRMNEQSIPFDRLMKDKMNPALLKQVVMEVKTMPSLAFMNLIKLIEKINPVRYKNLDATFMTYFTSSCGIPLILAIENIQYLFLLVSSAVYKTKITAYALNKTANASAKKCLSILNGMYINY